LLTENRIYLCWLALDTNIGFQLKTKKTQILVPIA